MPAESRITSMPRVKSEAKLFPQELVVSVEVLFDGGTSVPVINTGAW